MNKEFTNKTIRVEKGLWEKFMKVAREKDSDASKEIRKFIKKYVSINNLDKNENEKK